MSRSTVHRVPAEGPALSALDRVDYVDAYEVAVDPALPADPDWWRRKLLGDPGALTRAALRLRDLVVRPFGLVGGSMASIPVVATGVGEAVIGLDDRHLDFRLGIRVHDGRLRLTTTVRFNNALGRAYFLPVRPVHGRVVVPALLRRAARVGVPSATREGSTASAMGGS